MMIANGNFACCFLGLAFIISERSGLACRLVHEEKNAYWFLMPACMLVQVKVRWQHGVIDNTKLDRELLDLPPNKVKAMTIMQQK